jgi:hypothetical protein
MFGLVARIRHLEMRVKSKMCMIVTTPTTPSPVGRDQRIVMRQPLSDQMRIPKPPASAIPNEIIARLIDSDLAQ